ncbi:SIS domain-containing protein [bacterium]|nr:SIS domain-containing protein [bacterium]
MFVSNEGTNYTYNEIIRQQSVWEKALGSLEENKSKHNAYLDKYKNHKWIFTGCGTSYYLAQTGSYIFKNLTGIETSAVPASEIIMFPESIINKNSDYLLIPISRSGTSTETIQAAQAVKNNFNAPVLSISCDPASTLVNESDLSITFPFEKEQSVVMTGSFTTMLLSTLFLSSLYKENSEIAGKITGLPESSQRLMEKYEPYIKEIAENPDMTKFVFLGQGPFYGIANESALKIQEMSISAANSYHSLEYRHGPMSTATENTLITIFGSENGSAYEGQLIGDLKNLGAKILYLQKEDNSQFSAAPHFIITIPSNYGDVFKPFFYMPLMHLLGYYKAVSKNLNPDKPKNLSAVVTF